MGTAIPLGTLNGNWFPICPKFEFWHADVCPTEPFCPHCKMNNPDLNNGAAATSWRQPSVGPAGSATELSALTSVFSPTPAPSNSLTNTDLMQRQSSASTGLSSIGRLPVHADAERKNGFHPRSIAGLPHAGTGTTGRSPSEPLATSERQAPKPPKIAIQFTIDSQEVTELGDNMRSFSAPTRHGEFFKQFDRYDLPIEETALALTLCNASKERSVEEFAYTATNFLFNAGYDKRTHRPKVVLISGEDVDEVLSCFRLLTKKDSVRTIKITMQATRFSYFEEDEPQTPSLPVAIASNNTTAKATTRDLDTATVSSDTASNGSDDSLPSLRKVFEQEARKSKRASGKGSSRLGRALSEPIIIDSPASVRNDLAVSSLRKTPHSHSEEDATPSEPSTPEDTALADNMPRTNAADTNVEEEDQTTEQRLYHKEMKQQKSSKKRKRLRFEEPLPVRRESKRHGYGLRAPSGRNYRQTLRGN